MTSKFAVPPTIPPDVIVTSAVADRLKVEDAMDIGTENSIFILQGADATTPDTEGGSLSMVSGTGTGTAVGGDIILIAGSGSEGGSVEITAGSSLDDDGADVVIRGGTGTSGGGGIFLNAANGVDNADGGDIQLNAGNGDDDGGDISLNAGNGDDDGGDINIVAGNSDTGSGGGINITSGGTGSGSIGIIQFDGPVRMFKDSVTQGSGSGIETTVADLNTRFSAGIITTQSTASIGLGTKKFTVNYNIDWGVVLLTIVDYAGTLVTNGIPVLSVDSVVSNTSFDINITNAHATNGLTGALQIAYTIF